MNRLALTRRLPLMLGIALRLRDAGADHACIAAALDIEPAGVGPLLEVAEAKLRHLTATAPAGQPDTCQPDQDPTRSRAETEARGQRRAGPAQRPDRKE